METNLTRTPRDRGRELRVTSLVGAVTEDSSSVESPTIPDHPVLSDERWPRSVAEFERLVDRFQHELVRFAFCRLRNRADAEDVVQDVLLRTYRDRDRRGDDVPVAPYLAAGLFRTRSGPPTVG
jgi:hypothetical protein